MKSLGRSIVTVLATATFCLASEEPVIESVSVPQEDSVYYIGEILDIAWTPAAAYEGVNIVIDLSINGGMTWTQISPEEAAIPNSEGGYAWTIPESLQVYDRTAGEWVTQSIVCDTVLMEIYEYDGETAHTIVGPFSIQPPSNAAARFGVARAANHSMHGGPRSSLVGVIPGSSRPPAATEVIDLRGRAARGTSHGALPYRAGGIYVPVERR
jgi:hypothetical protein